MAIGSLRHQHSKRKIKIFSFRVVCRSIANHPFLLFVLLFLICLHKYSPFLFSLLVSASPVLVCTAVLLGTLLIHGKPNDYNLKYHEDMSNAGVTLRNGSEGCHLHSGDREGIFFKDRFAELRNDIVEKSMKTSGMLDSGIKVTDNATNGIKMEYCNVELGTGIKMHNQKSNGDLDFANFEKENVEMRMEQDYGKHFRGDHVVGVQKKSGSSLGRRKHVDGTDNNQVDTNNQESSECESDGADKSSFDALVADVIPTAQETHPLLDSEDPLHLVGSHNASLNYEFQSLDSNQSSEDSGEDDNVDKVEEDNEKLKVKEDGNKDNELMEMEKNQNLEDLISRTNDERDEAEEESEDDGSVEDTEVEDDDDDDDDEDNEEKENNNVEKDAGKQVTMWTEEDEKNMRLVGNSEFERDLRLENLLARRRAKRNFSMISEKNLIDLDRPILPFHCAPISTARVNPFDVPSDTNHQYCDIPPIPGSAPSVSVPNRNPFDSPCTSPKEIQDPLGDHVLKEEPMETNLNENGSSSIGYNFDYVGMNRKDAIFRRYESFSSGYIYIGESSRQDFMETEQRDAVLRRHETFNTRSTSKLGSQETVYRKMRPFFVPEHMDRIQEARRSSSSHDSDSTVSSFESDHFESLNTSAKHEDAEPSKDTTATTAEDDHVSSNSEDTSSESSDVVDSVHDNSREEFEASLEVTAEVHADQMYSRTNAAHDQNHDNASSNTISKEDQSSENNDRDENEDEMVNESELSPKASSVGTIEPPVFDTSPTGAEKSTTFSSSHSPNEMEKLEY